MTEKILCPKCGYDGKMNRFIGPISSKTEDKNPKHTKDVTIIVIEYYCPHCEQWIKKFKEL